LVLSAIALAAGIWIWQTRRKAALELQEAVQLLPSAAETVIGFNVALLRVSGVLDRIAGSPEMESSDYRKFVKDAGFDYRRDLDYAVAGFEKESNRFVLRGRFDWPTLERYAIANGGSCADGVCSLQTDSGKVASFTLAKPNLLSLSVGPQGPGTKELSPPPGVVWAVMDNPPLPFEGGSRVVVSVQAGLDGLFARLVADCRGPDVCLALAARLESALERFRGGPPALASGIGKGRLQLLEGAVEVAWRLDSAALASLVPGERD
jgi:hypothetical protein